MGVLRVDYPEFKLKLLGPGGVRDVSGRTGQAVLPAGTYTLLEWALWARGADGRLWKATGGMGIEDLVISPNRVANLQLASPLKIQWGLVTMGNPHLIEMKIRGTSGEECCGVTVEGQAPPSPRFEVRDAAGQTVGSGLVTFCCKFRPSAQWTRDASAQGRFTVHVTADWGPFPIRMEEPLTLEVTKPSAPEPVASVGSPAPEVELSPTEGGSAVSLAGLRDRPVALCFFCGCAPCLEVAEGIARISGAHTLAVVTDAESFRGEALQRFRGNSGFRGPVLLDRDGAVGRRYRALTCPRVFLIDREGRLTFDSGNPHAEPAEILAAVNAALARLR
jgi:peroxiredoxin